MKRCGEMVDRVPRLRDRSIHLGYISLVVFRRAAHVQKGETELEDNERPGAGVPAPSHPKHIAQEKKPEAPLALSFRLSGDEVRGEKRNRHRRPLQVVHPFHNR